MSELTKKQRAEVEYAGNVISAVIGNKIYFYDSRHVSADSREARTNGWYDPSDGSIHLDIAKMESGEKSVLFTLSHELTHFIEDWSPAKYQTFANFLLKNYAEHGVKTDTLVLRKMAELKTSDYDYAMSELVADACERMLLDSNASEKLAELNKTDKGLVAKIKSFLTNTLKKIRQAYAQYKGREEAQLLQKMEDKLSEFYALFEDALTDAAQNYRDADGVLEGVSSKERNQKKQNYPLAKRKKSWYNQYTGRALAWSRSVRPGARKVFVVNMESSVLVEATESDYIELFRGAHVEVENYERAYAEAVDEVYGNTEGIKADQGRHLWDMQFSSDGGNDGGNGSSIGREGLQTDPSGNDGYLLSSDRRGQAKEQRKLTSTREILANLLEASIDASTPEGVRQADLLDEYRANIGEIEDLEYYKTKNPETVVVSGFFILVEANLGQIW